MQHFHRRSREVSSRSSVTPGLCEEARIAGTHELSTCVWESNLNFGGTSGDRTTCEIKKSNSRNRTSQSAEHSACPLEELRLFSTRRCISLVIAHHGYELGLMATRDTSPERAIGPETSDINTPLQTNHPLHASQKGYVLDDPLLKRCTSMRTPGYGP